MKQSSSVGGEVFCPACKHVLLLPSGEEERIEEESWDCRARKEGRKTSRVPEAAAGEKR